MGGSGGGVSDLNPDLATYRLPEDGLWCVILIGPSISLKIIDAHCNVFLIF